MEHILTHDRLHMSTDTVRGLAIMYVDKMDKRQNISKKEEQYAELSFSAVLSLCKWLGMHFGGVGHGFPVLL